MNPSATQAIKPPTLTPLTPLAGAAAPEKFATAAGGPAAPAGPAAPGTEGFFGGMPEAFGGFQEAGLADYNADGGAMNGRRSFTVQSSTAKGASGGTYLSTAPLNAAKKAARQLFAKSATRTNKIKFVLREMTRGSKKKTYKYVATKKKLSPPKTVMRGDVKIVLKHEYEVKADS